MQHPLLVDVLDEAVLGADRRAIVGSMSCAVGHRSQRDPEDAAREPLDASAAAWSASRVLPEPPAPVNVTTRATSMSAAISRSSSVRPTSGSSWAGRFVALSERSGGNGPGRAGTGARARRGP